MNEFCVCGHPKWWHLCEKPGAHHEGKCFIGVPPCGCQEFRPTKRAADWLWAWAKFHYHNIKMRAYSWWLIYTANR